jgi:hypothetical protein
MYRQLVFEKITYGILLFTSLVVVINGIFKLNVLKLIPNPLTYMIYFTIMCSIVYNIFRRDYYLPFLGNSVYPCKSLKPVTPENASVEVKVENLTPSVNIVYWASEKKNGKDVIINTPWEAYDSNANSGVTLSDSYGKAILKIREPVSYRIPTGSIQKKHVHYRECIGNGMLGPVQTIYT